jgi:hypothetical protein
VCSGFEFLVSSEIFINRFKRAKKLCGVIKNTSNISRVSNGQVISGVRLKGLNFGMNLRAKHWKLFFRVDERSKSSHSYVSSVC